MARFNPYMSGGYVSRRRRWNKPFHLFLGPKRPPPTPTTPRARHYDYSRRSINDFYRNLNWRGKPRIPSKDLRAARRDSDWKRARARHWGRAAAATAGTTLAGRALEYALDWAETGRRPQVGRSELVDVGRELITDLIEDNGGSRMANRYRRNSGWFRRRRRYGRRYYSRRRRY